MSHALVGHSTTTYSNTAVNCRPGPRPEPDLGGPGGHGRGPPPVGAPTKINIVLISPVRWSFMWSTAPMNNDYPSSMLAPGPHQQNPIRRINYFLSDLNGTIGVDVQNMLARRLSRVKLTSFNIHWTKWHRVHARAEFFSLIVHA